MNIMRFVLGLSVVVLVVLLSHSQPTAAVDVSLPSRRAVVEHLQEADEHTPFQPRKLGVHIRKGGGGARGGGRFVRGTGGGRSSSSSAVPTHMSSFQLAAILGCSLFLVIFLL